MPASFAPGGPLRDLECVTEGGNFPQAFSYLSLISVAVNLDRQLDHGPGSV